MTTADPPPPPLPPLLCERCRYDLTGLKRSDVCPECGVAMERSLPSPRVGLPIQHRASVRAWLATGMMMWRDNPRVRSCILPYTHRSARVEFLSLAMLGLAILVPYIAMFIAEMIRADTMEKGRPHLGVSRGQTFIYGMMILGGVVVAVFALYGLIRLLSFGSAWAASRLSAGRSHAVIYQASLMGAVAAIFPLVAWAPVLTLLIVLLEYFMEHAPKAAAIFPGGFVFLGTLILAGVCLLACLSLPVVFVFVLKNANLPGSEARLADAGEASGSSREWK